ADHGIGAAGAETEAIDRLDLDSVVALEDGRQRLDAARLAGFGPAELDERPLRRRALEVVIESDDAVHLGAGEVQRLGDERHGRGRDVAKRGLDVVEDRQQRALALLVPAQDLADLILDTHPGGLSLNTSCLGSRPLSGRALPCAYRLT